MQILTSYAIEKSTFVIRATFKDEDLQLGTPDSISWSLVDPDGNIINSLQDQSETPATVVDIVLSGDDLQIRDSDNEWETRYLEIYAVYDSDIGNNLPLRDRAEFKILNLKSI